jgi:hypothetical protein
MRLRRRRSAAPVVDVPVLYLPTAPQPGLPAKSASGLRRAARQRA